MHWAGSGEADAKELNVSGDGDVKAQLSHWAQAVNAMLL